MSLLPRFTELQQLSRKKQNTFPPTDTDDMAFFAQSSSSQLLAAPPAPSSKRSMYFQRPRDDVDEFLASDLELSFASTVSLSSPPREPISLTPGNESCEPMDISPVPVSKLAFTRACAQKTIDKAQRPRALTGGARMFGDDMSNRASPLPSTKTGTSNMGSKRTQRAALPFEWMAASKSVEHLAKPVLSKPQQVPPSPIDDPMEVDTSLVQVAPSPVPSSSMPSSPAPLSAAPTITQFNNLFYETMSPSSHYEGSPSGREPKKRRSLSPGSVRRTTHDASSSPAPPSSPSARKLERMSSGPILSRMNSKHTLQGLGSPSNVPKRPRRPALSAVIHPSDSAQIQSAEAVMSTGEFNTESAQVLPPVRRAFSALLPPTGFGELSSDESSLDGPDMSSPAQAYAKRQQVKTIRRCDGTDDFRPLTGATAMVHRDKAEIPSAGATGMPGFGDNESHGKILPCHRVTEDGLMRINSETLDALLDGIYHSQIAHFYIIDCRFDYEYSGGHIPSAVNINTTTGVEDFLLGNAISKPRPSISGDSAKKTVLVFHCEFSVKRAPTFAKHLRARDRAMNNHVYPKIHYPEVYILEGGYCEYYKQSAARCEPCSYVTMDDPTHAASRREDLDQFRKAKFGRTKSYAYGDGVKMSMFTQPLQPKRNTAPSGGSNSLFAAANAARTRRGGSGLTTLPEDNIPQEDDGDDLGDSPCPPPTKVLNFKVKKIGRVPLARAETYGPNRMAY